MLSSHFTEINYTIIWFTWSMIIWTCASYAPFTISDTKPDVSGVSQMESICGGTVWEKWPRPAWKLQNQHLWGKTLGRWGAGRGDKPFVWVVCPPPTRGNPTSYSLYITDHILVFQARCTANCICLRKTIPIPCELCFQKLLMINFPNYFFVFITNYQHHHNYLFTVHQ